MRQGDPDDTESQGAQEPSALAGGCRRERLEPGDHLLSVRPPCAERSATLRALEMSGSYPLTDEAIDGAMTRTSPGNYALGYMDGDTFSVFYVGRSDSDVRRRLHEWVGMPSRNDRYAPATKAAWASSRSGAMPLSRPALGCVSSVDSSYTRFAYSYAPSAEAAFEKESRNYEDFGGGGGLDNGAPPAWVA